MQNQPWNWYPALVFTDLVMGGLGGYQFIRRLAELYPKREIPVIVTSKLNSGLDVAEAEIAGADAYLIKPINAETVIETIRQVMNKKQRKMILKDAQKKQKN
jgi:CheY-like chemotaxis protein